MQAPLPVSTDNHCEQIVVRSHGRLHFGLVEISESQPNCFGGIGLMVESSDATVKAAIGNSTSADCEIQADTYWKSRIESVMQHWLQTHSELPVRKIRVVTSPLPHQGLGSGTQMACTIAALLLASYEYLQGNNPASDDVSHILALEPIAQLSQRGKRSHIGLRGFVEGGLILDHGLPIQKENAPEACARTERVPFPDWPVLIIRNTASAGDSGNEEAKMFEQCKHQINANRESMIQLIHQQVLPAIRMQDWARWNDALGLYGRWAGQIFEPVQGGIYRNAQIAETITVAKLLGLAGATQSSWGPTVCAFARDEEHAIWCSMRLKGALPHSEIAVTKAANASAQVLRI